MGQSNSEILVKKDFIVGYSPTVLTIKVHELYSLNAPGEQDLDDLSSINNGISISGYGKSKKDFVSEVPKNKHAKWLIEKNDPNGEDKNYDLRLISVTAKNPGNSVFDDNPLYVNQDNEIKGKITKGAVNEIFPYTINFLISNKDGGDIKVYSIDPELRLIPPTSS